MKLSLGIQSVSKYFEEYSSKSSLSGVQYFGDTKRTAFERIIWLIIWIICVYLSTIYVLETYTKWNTSPVFVTIGIGQVAVQNVAFPAVTICPKSKTNKDIFNYTDILRRASSNKDSLSELELLQLEYMSMICNRTYSVNEVHSHRGFGTEMLSFLNKAKPNFDETFLSCKFADVKMNCSKIFTPIFTRTGVCYTFNSLDHEEMYNEIIPRFEDYQTAPKSVCFKEEYTKKCKNVYPRRSSFSGNSAGLQVELGAAEKNLDFTCVSALQGFKVILHDPSEIPLQSHHHFLLPLDEAIFVAVTPEVIITKPELKSYPYEHRKCYFDDEIVLNTFKHYTQANCQAECWIRLIERFLNCTDFYMPRRNNSNGICGKSNSVFVDLFAKIMFNIIHDTEDLNLSNFNAKMYNYLNKKHFFENITKHCTCLPSCSSVDYAFETTQTDYLWERRTKPDNKFYRSILNVFFKRPQYIPLRREEMFGSMDFIAYSGGVLGIFTGFSFISLIEIVYFATLRIGCNVIMYGKNFWYGKTD